MNLIYAEHRKAYRFFSEGVADVLAAYCLADSSSAVSHKDKLLARRGFPLPQIPRISIIYTQCCSMTRHESGLNVVSGPVAALSFSRLYKEAYHMRKKKKVQDNMSVA